MIMFLSLDCMRDDYREIKKQKKLDAKMQGRELIDSFSASEDDVDDVMEKLFGEEVIEDEE